MNSTLDNVPTIHWYNSKGYQCNIDFTKPERSGVNINPPIHAVHSSTPINGNPTEVNYGQSALDPQPQQPRNSRSTVTDVLNLNLI